MKEELTENSVGSSKERLSRKSKKSISQYDNGMLSIILFINISLEQISIDSKKEYIYEQNSSGSSKEDPKNIIENSNDSIESQKETLTIQFEDRSRPSSKIYRDVSVGMSQVDISESEQESIDDNLLPSNNFVIA